MKNERTGKRAASIAGRILDKIRIHGRGDYVWVATDSICIFNVCSVKELKILAASALTQSPDKPKRKK